MGLYTRRSKIMLYIFSLLFLHFKRKIVFSFCTEFISTAANTLRNHRSKTSVGKYVHSILQCHVILDRLEQSTIDQIMQNSAEDDDKCISISVRIFYLRNKIVLSIIFIFIIVNNRSIIRYNLS